MFTFAYEHVFFAEPKRNVPSQLPTIARLPNQFSQVNIHLLKLIWSKGRHKHFYLFVYLRCPSRIRALIDFGLFNVTTPEIEAGDLWKEPSQGDDKRVGNLLNV